MKVALCTHCTWVYPALDPLSGVGGGNVRVRVRFKVGLYFKIKPYSHKGLSLILKVLVFNTIFISPSNTLDQATLPLFFRLTPPKVAVHNTCRPRSPAHEGTGAASIEGASACLTNRAAASALSLVGGACTVKSQ